MGKHLTNQIMPFDISKYSYIKHMDLTEILGSSAFGAIVLEAVRYIKRKSQNKDMASKSLLALTEIYSKCMKPVLENTPVERFMILKAENGGGNIVPGTILYITAIYEDYRPPFKKGLHKIDRWRADRVSIEMISAVCSQGSVSVIVDEMEDDNKSYDFYVSEKIAQSEVYFLAQRKDKIFYCSLSTSTKVNLDTPEIRNEIAMSLDRLREIFKKSIKYL